MKPPEHQTKSQRDASLKSVVKNPAPSVSHIPMRKVTEIGKGSKKGK